MAIGIGTALLLGVLGGGVAATVMSRKAAQPQAQPATQAQARVQAPQIAAQQKATTEVLAAPEKAAEKARLDSLQRRKRRAKTLLTSPAGVLEPATLTKKKLFGA